MICPFCKHEEDKVIDSRSSGYSIRRRRECLACKKRFTTYEYIEKSALNVIKRDNSREAFQRDKLLNGLIASCKKRPISSEEIEKIAEEIENELFALAKPEISYEEIGNLVMKKLKALDSVAYIRFASVYRQFEEVGEFVDQIRSLKKKQ